MSEIMDLDIQLSDSEIQELFETSLGTIEHFAPSKIESAESLGRNTIPQGNTRGLLTAAERAMARSAISSAVKAQSSSQGKNNPKQLTQPPSLSQAPENLGARPKTPQRGTHAKPSLPKGEEPPKEGPPTQASAKDAAAALALPLEPTEPATASGPDPAVFKRGPNSGRPPSPGHRREYSITWGPNGVSIVEWCNPKCAPIKIEPAREKCRCGYCPKLCENCARDKRDSH